MMPSPVAGFVLGLIVWVTGLEIPALCVVMWIRYRERRRRWDHDACPECGYDLRASPGRCPECGAIPERFAADERV